MKRIVAFALMMFVMGYIFINLFDSALTFKTMEIAERDSKVYIDRSVTRNSGEVVFGETQNLESSAANTVAAIVSDYRSFDTLGEVTVLFVSSLGITFLLGGLGLRVKFKNQPSSILTMGGRIIFGFILTFGVYMYLHGHLTPGGGFPGGALIATAFLLLYLADDTYRLNLQRFKFSEGTSGFFFVLIGIGGVFFANYFLQNILPTGTIGELFSGGVLPIINILIGQKVGSELVVIFDHFMREEVVS